MSKQKRLKDWAERRIPETVAFNRAMTWLDGADGVEAGIIAYCSHSPVWLTGTESSFSWQTIQEEDSLAPVDEERSLLEIRGNADESGAYAGHVEIPLEQLPRLELNVSESDAPFQLILTPWDAYTCDNMRRSWHNDSRILFRSEILATGSTLTVDLEKGFC